MLKSSVNYFLYADWVFFSFCSSATTNLSEFVIACLGYWFLPGSVLVSAYTGNDICINTSAGMQKYISQM